MNTRFFFFDPNLMRSYPQDVQYPNFGAENRYDLFYGIQRNNSSSLERGCTTNGELHTKTIIKLREFTFEMAETNYETESDLYTRQCVITQTIHDATDTK